MNPNINYVDNYEGIIEFMKWMNEDHSILSIDTETSGLNWWDGELRLVQFGDDNKAWVIPFQGWKSLIKDVIEKYNRPIAFHNAKFDIHWLDEADINVPKHQVHDTQIMAHLLYSCRKTALKELSKKFDGSYYKAQTALDDYFHKHNCNWDTIPLTTNIYWLYAGMDVIMTSMLYLDLMPKLQRDKQLSELYDMEISCMFELLNMEKRGFKIDIPYLNEIDENFENYIKNVENWALKEYNIDIRKTSQLSKALLNDGWSPTKYTKTGKISLSQEVFEEFDHPLSNAYISMKKHEKTSSTFIKNLVKYADKNDIVRGSIRQLGTITGRMSVTDPALQTMPRSALIRNAFIPREGNKLVAIDYDQMELRLGAHYSEDPGLIDACNQDDVHVANARLIYGKEEINKDERQLAKNGIYCVMYHGSDATLAKTVNISDSEARQFKNGVFSAFPGLKRFMDASSKTQNYDNDYGSYYIRTRDGRYQWASSSKSKYMLTNYMIQGTGADILKQKINAMSTDELLSQSMILPMHDEVLFECPEDKAFECLQKGLSFMEDNSFNPSLTVSGDILQKWGDKYD